jgi:hypothetical protein
MMGVLETNKIQLVSNIRRATYQARINVCSQKANVCIYGISNLTFSNPCNSFYPFPSPSISSNTKTLVYS